MKRQFLLALSASQASLYAAESCFILAERVGGKVLAQHVIDSAGAWELLGHDKPGFLGNGSFESAHDQVVKLLQSLGADLAAAYKARAAERGVESECVIVTGNPVEEVCRQAKDCQLVVIGHRACGFETVEDERRHAMRFSVAESLAHECPRPLMVVQDQCQPWSDMRIVFEMDHVNGQYINSCLRLARFLSIEPELYCLSTGTHEEDPCRFIKDLREANPAIGDIPVQVKRIDNQIINEADSAWWTSETEIEFATLPDTLIVIPTRTIEKRRITVFGTSPAYFIRHLSLPAILLWPEEYPAAFEKDEAEAQRMVKG